MSFAKKCDICGELYEPYGTVIDQEEDATATAEDNEDIIISDENLANADYDFDATGEAPEINGFRWLTVDEYGNVQYSHTIWDICETCRDAIMDYIVTLMPENQE